jgi:hypothetical protein
MPAQLELALPPALAWGLPAAALALGLVGWRLRRAGQPWRRVLALLALRALVLGLVVFLLARPHTRQRADPRQRPRVAVLLDRSRSMGLADAGRVRFDAALELAHALGPALERAGFEPEPYLFDAASVSARPTWPLGGTPPSGARTDLGAALQHALAAHAPAPVALILLSDGVANAAGANATALLSLHETRAALAAVAFGTDAGLPSLDVQRALAPSSVPPRETFRIAAQLQAAGAGVPDFDLDLLRDGQRVQTRRIVTGDVRHGRLWLEGFDWREEQAGAHEYGLVARPLPGVRVASASLRALAAVRIGSEPHFRVLYVQGALTWDFKFIGRAVRQDAGLRLTGLSRTSQHSVFRQNVESAGELAAGFPRTTAEIAPYRVVVLSDLKPADFSADQQQLLARFCGELGGGVLLIGGPDTFDTTWQGSRLEQLLPVTFDPDPGLRGLERPFRLELTDDARASPVFQVAEGAQARRAWDALPTFSVYGRVRAAKPGALVWARHDQDDGPQGRRVLMAAHAYGAGLAAVIAVQNLWRWRLARDSDVGAYDRFWRQLLRYLGQSGREQFSIQVSDQELRVGAVVRAQVEKRPRPEALGDDAGDGREYVLRVNAPGGASILEQRARLQARVPLELRFTAAQEGLYALSVAAVDGPQLASQQIEVRAVDHELARTGRDLDALRQWTSIGQGFVAPAEELGLGLVGSHAEQAIPAADTLVARLRARVDALRPARERQVPWRPGVALGLAWFAALLGEWLLRRRWELT